MLGSGLVSGSVVWAPDSWSKGRGFESRRENVLLQFNCLFRYPFYSHVTAVARKRSRSFCPKCTWHVIAKHAPQVHKINWICMNWCGMVHGCMAYTERAQSAVVSHDTSHVATKQCCYYTTSVDSQNAGAGIAQWLEHRTRDWKVAGSNPCWNGGRIFFSRVDFLCWLLFRYPFHPRVTAVARKKSRSFCQKCRWQVTAKHAYTLRMWILLNRASALVTTCP